MLSFLNKSLLFSFVFFIYATQIFAQTSEPLLSFSSFPDDIIFQQFNLMNFLNNQSFVQFLHRSFAYLITFFIIIIGIKMFIDNQVKFIKYYLFVFLILVIQVVLGIFTLISGLNLYLASLHQITSVILVFTVLNFNHKLS